MSPTFPALGYPGTTIVDAAGVESVTEAGLDGDGRVRDPAALLPITAARTARVGYADGSRLDVGRQA